MHREMRRKDRQITQEQAMKLLKQAEYGTLSTVGPDNQPYATPLSFVVLGGCIYFHCAQVGQKLDNIAHEPRVCFCAVDKTQPVFDGGFSTYYESAVVYGTAEKCEDDNEKIRILAAISEKYLPEHMDKADDYIARFLSATAVYKISIEHITGKAKAAKP